MTDSEIQGAIRDAKSSGGGAFFCSMLVLAVFAWVLSSGFELIHAKIHDLEARVTALEARK